LSKDFVTVSMLHINQTVRQRAFPYWGFWNHMNISPTREVQSSVKPQIQEGFVLVLQIWTRSFALAKKVLYCLSCMPILFCSGYFGDSVLIFVRYMLLHSTFFPSRWALQTLFPGLPWNHDLSLQHSLGWQVHTTASSCWLW
jgi:hypothetical protein